jgi:uncharacterized repeat protein (TIGR01451 family)
VAGLLAGGSAALSLIGGVGVGSAVAAPGTPGAPAVIYAEDFENTALTPVLLTGYTGAPSTNGMTYTADAPWLTGCNGAVVAFNSPAADNADAGCTSNGDYTRVRQLAQALGNLRDPATADDNHAVTAYTENNPGADAVQFKTNSPIPLSGTSRFLTFSVDVSNTNCFASHALFKFYLLDGTTEIPTFTTPIDACAGAGTGTGTGTFASNDAVLFGGSSVGIVLRNGQGSGGGNDAAFDNIRMLDATPQLDKSFSPASVPQGSNSTLTFTITNTSELAAKAGWSFADTLPAGLTVAAAPTTTCPSGSPTATVGSDQIAMTGDLSAGMASCTVSVPVTSSAVATYINGPNNMTEAGLDPPGSASVAFTPVVDLSLTKSASADPYTPGTPLSYTLMVRNVNGPSAAIGATVSDPLPHALGDGFTWTCVASAGSACGPSGSGDIDDTVNVAVGGTLTYTVTGTVPSGTTGRVVNSATVTPPAGTTDSACDPSCGDTVTVSPEIHTDLSVVKSALPSPYVPGTALTYTVTVANAGPSDASGVTVADPLPADLAGAGFTWTCAGTGGSTCTASGSGDIADTAAIVADQSVVYTVTGTVPAGVQGTLDNTAIATPATGVVDPDCNPSCSDSIETAAQPHTDLSITKDATPKPYVPGEALTYTVTVANAGPSDAIGATVTDAIPPALTGAGFTWTCVASTDSSCAAAGTGADIDDVVTVRVGGTLTYTVTGTVPSGVQTDLANTATITPPPGAVDTNCATRCGATVTIKAEPHTLLTIKKSASASPYIPGTAVSYTIVVGNTGVSDAIGATVTDALPDGLSGAGFTWTCTASAGSACTASGSGDIADTVTVVTGGTLVYTVTGTVPSHVQGELGNTATIAPSGDAVDPGCRPSCSSTVTIDAQVHTALSITKTSAPARYVAGGTLTYTVTVRNAGPSDAVGATVADSLPAVISGAGFSWTCQPSSGSSCQKSGIGDISDTVTVAADGSVVYTVTGTVPAGATGAIVNTASVTPPPGAVDVKCGAGCSASTTNEAAPTMLAQTGMQLAALSGQALLLILGGLLLLLVSVRRKRT